MSLPLSQFHGTDSRYQAGCRCKKCRRAHAADQYRNKINRAMSLIEPGDARHGENGYMNYYCRCRVCRDGHREAIRQRAAQLAPDDPRHGRYATYVNHGCRCDACTEATRVYRAHLRKRAGR